MKKVAIGFIAFSFPLLSLAATATKPANTLLYGETVRLDSIDPYTSHEAAAKRLSDLIFDSLVEVGLGGNYKPSLAKEWDIADGGASVNFVLRDDVFWQRGKDGSSRVRFTAKDIEKTIHLLQNKESEIPNQERFQIIKGVEVKDPYHIRVVLNRAMVDPLQALLFKILPAHELKDTKALKRQSNFAMKPLGTGAYQIEKINDQGEVLLTANAEYFRGKPKIKQILMKPFNDQTIMAQSLMFNALDLITYVSPRDFGEISGDQKISLMPYDALSFSFLALNNNRGPMKDKRFRQAVSYAINRDEMLKAFFAGKGTLISGPFPPTSWAYNLDVAPIKYNMDKANQLLQQAGFKRTGTALTDKDGKPIKLQFVVPIAGEGETVKRLVLACQNYLAQLGIQTELQFMDWLVWKKRVMKEHDYDMTIASWSFDDANNITSLFHSSSTSAWGNNFVEFRNPQVDALLTEANATNDFDKKRSIYQKLHAILADEAPYTYLWTLTHHAAHQNRLKGAKVEPTAFFRHILSWRLSEGSTHGTN